MRRPAGPEPAAWDRPASVPGISSRSRWGRRPLIGVTATGPRLRTRKGPGSVARIGPAELGVQITQMLVDQADLLAQRREFGDDVITLGGLGSVQFSAEVLDLLRQVPPNSVSDRNSGDVSMQDSDHRARDPPSQATADEASTAGTPFLPIKAAPANTPPSTPAEAAPPTRRHSHHGLYRSCPTPRRRQWRPRR